MKVLFTDDQLTEMESSAHKQVVEDDWVVVEWTYDLIKEVRHYKSIIAQSEKAFEEVKTATLFLQHVPPMGMLYDLAEINLKAIRGE